MSSSLPPTQPPTPQPSTDLGDLCPPCKLLLNGNGAIAKLNLFFQQLDELDSLGFELTYNGTKEAIEIICGFDKKMDEVLELLIHSVQKKA